MNSIKSQVASRKSAKTKGAALTVPLDHYTYRVTWSPEDAEYVGLCAEFASLSWLAGSPEAALAGIRKVVAASVADMLKLKEPVPEALAERRYSGEFRVRIPPEVHRSLALEAAEQGVSLNRLASARLAA
jgi:predicted HicB family RNase H-like nuclease